MSAPARRRGAASPVERNAVGNLLSAAENGLKHGATGYLNTDWGDYGHWQVLPVSYLGFAAGAAYSWALEANRNLDIPRVLSLYAFRDPTGSMGRVAYGLGNVYRVIGPEPHNASVLFRVLQWPLDKVHTLYKDLSGAAFHHAIDAIDQAILPLLDAQIARLDAGLIMQEFILTARLLRHACRRALLALEENPTQAAQLRRELDRDMQELIPQYRKVWLARNRPGGLADSVARFETIRKDYE